MPRGYEVIGVESGAEAFSWLADNAADIVLLDIVMPEMNGYEVCRRLRQNPATEVLPVVMLTSSGDEDKVRAIEAGADDFISRPVNEAELLRASAPCFGSSSSTTRSSARLPSLPSGTARWRTGSAPRSRISSDSDACAGSCRRSSPS